MAHSFLCSVSSTMLIGCFLKDLNDAYSQEIVPFVTFFSLFLIFTSFGNLLHLCSCGLVVEHCVSSAKVVGSIPRDHILINKCIA